MNKEKINNTSKEKVSIKKRFKNRRGGLGKILAAVFSVIIVVYVLISAIHPSANVIKSQGQSAGQKVIEERSNIESDFVPIPMLQQD